MENFITYQQAVQHKQLQEVAESYEEMVKEVNLYFAKNTLAQLSNMEVWFEAMDLMPYYANKDYSNLLFDQTEKLFDKFTQVKKDVIKAEPAFLKIKEVFNKIQNKINEKDNNNDTTVK